MAAIDDGVTQLQGVVRQLGALVSAVQTAFPRISGTFTLSAATTTDVTQTAIAANGIVLPFPTNATAALFMATQGLYQSATTSGAGFSMSTGTGVPAGTETFQYVVLNPS